MVMVRRALAVVCLTIATLTLPAAPAHATIYYPCSVGTSIDKDGLYVAWSDCPTRPSQQPGTTQYRTWARFCTAGTCTTKQSNWRNYGYGRIRVKAGLGDDKITVDVRYR